MKAIKQIALVGLLVLVARVGNSQGYVNLNFESANLTGYPPDSTVPATNAFPGWTVNAQYIIYDDISLSGQSISIISTNSPGFTSSIQGKYYAFFEAGNSPCCTQTVALAQTGTIPIGTKSISFWGNIGGLQITFAGQPLAFSGISTTPNYNIYGADISAFAGQPGQLLFSLPAYLGEAELDNIQFSSQPAPEPEAISLLAVGSALACWRLAKNRRPS